MFGRKEDVCVGTRVCVKGRGCVEKGRSMCGGE